CAGLDAQLADLPGLLADTPAPPMPDALTARITAALAAEAAARSTLTPAGAAAAEAAGTAAEAPGSADAGAAPAQPRTAAGRRRRAGRARPALAPARSGLALRIAVAAAAIVVVGGGGYEAAHLLSGGQAGQGSAASGASGEAPGAGRAASRQPVMAGPARSAASSGNKARSALANPPVPAAVLSSGINYRTGQLKTQVEATIARVREKAPSPRPSHSTNGTPVLASCLKRVAENQRPLLV